MNNILETKNLSFKSILKYPDITVPSGRATFITGQSGGGKSTLLKLFNSMLSPSNGEIFYDGQNIATLDTISLRQKVLLIGQGVFLFDNTIRDNFLQFYDCRELPPPSDEKIREFLATCCAPFSLDAHCTNMSGGERQRIYMAIYISFMPEVLMLDEPTSALDNENSYQVMKSIVELCHDNGITLIVVSHDQKLTDMFSENTIEIKREEI
ncbi:MAG: ABC transporter ATP-binding protein [Proteocatella sp.]